MEREDINFHLGDNKFSQSLEVVEGKRLEGNETEKSKEMGEV